MFWLISTWNINFCIKKREYLHAITISIIPNVSTSKIFAFWIKIAFDLSLSKWIFQPYQNDLEYCFIFHRVSLSLKLKF
jgi:hypothetical protein